MNNHKNTPIFRDIDGYGQNLKANEKLAIANRVRQLYPRLTQADLDNGTLRNIPLSQTVRQTGIVGDVVRRNRGSWSFVTFNHTNTFVSNVSSTQQQ
jgi:hypothetical protein